MKTLRSLFRRRRAVLLHAGLACVLLASQAMAYAHSLDAESHAAGDACEICITIGGLGGTTPAKAAVAFTIAAPGAEPPGYCPPRRAGAFRAHRLARGPPAAS